MKNRPQLTRKCAVCKIEKPLSAFLQKGNTYGSVCSSCQAAAQSGDEEDGGTSSTRKTLRVDENARYKAEVEQKEAEEKTGQAAREDREQKDKTSTEQKDKKTLREQQERKHRETYLEKQEIVVEHIETVVDHTGLTPEAMREIEFQKSTTIEQAIGQEKRMNTGVDFTTPLFTSQFAQTRFTDNASLRNFLGWAGPGTPIARTFAQSHAAKPEGAKAAPSHPVTMADLIKPTEPSKKIETSKPTASTESKKMEATASIKKEVTPSTAFGLHKQPSTQPHKSDQGSLLDRMTDTWGPASRKR